jgi:hypothetical protein
MISLPPLMNLEQETTRANGEEMVQRKNLKKETEIQTSPTKREVCLQTMPEVPLKNYIEIVGKFLYKYRIS